MCSTRGMSNGESQILDKCDKWRISNEFYGAILDLSNRKDDFPMNAALHLVIDLDLKVKCSNFKILQLGQLGFVWLRKC